MSTYSTNIPGAPGYEQANLLARRAYENAMSRYAQRRSQSLQRYGYTRDAQGNLGVDPNNEYGAYQQTLRGDDQESRGLDRAQRSSGWGQGSGFFGQQADDLQYAQGEDQARLGTSLQDELSGIAEGEQGAAYDRDQALYQGELEATREAIGQGNFNPANYEDLDVPEYGEPGPRRRPARRPPTRQPHRKGGQNVHHRGKERLIRRTLERQARGRRR